MTRLEITQAIQAIFDTVLRVRAVSISADGIAISIKSTTTDELSQEGIQKAIDFILDENNLNILVSVSISTDNDNSNTMLTQTFQLSTV